MKLDKLTLVDLGFNSFFVATLNDLPAEDLRPARVIAEYRQAYRVKNEQGEFLARVTGKRMFEATGREDYPAVGDFVMIAPVDSEQVSIQAILPRQTIIKRSFGDKNKVGEKSDIQIIATNIDVGFVIESVDRDYNLNRFERYLVMLEEGGVKAALILNKIDLLPKEETEQKLVELKNRFPEIDVILTSTVNSDGLSALEEYIKRGKTYCFLGSSGVGKSSLINQLLGTNQIKTGAVSEYSERGRHTTTGRQMYFLDNGGIVIDNPGIREVGMTDGGEGVAQIFAEITAISSHCKFANCTHVHEPECAVLAALKEGTLMNNTYTNYLNLRQQAEYQNLHEKQKRQKSKVFGKSINKAKKTLRDIE